MKTVKVMTSCRIFNWARLRKLNPSRFAGTCKTYSKKAIPQLTVTATHSGADERCFKCPYQANVINRLEVVSKLMVSSRVVAGLRLFIVNGVRRRKGKSFTWLPESLIKASSMLRFFGSSHPFDKDFLRFPPNIPRVWRDTSHFRSPKAGVRP